VYNTSASSGESSHHRQEEWKLKTKTFWCAYLSRGREKGTREKEKEVVNMETPKFMVGFLFLPKIAYKKLTKVWVCVLDKTQAI